MDRPNGGRDRREDDHAARPAQPMHAAPSAPPPIALSEVVGGGHAGTVRRSDESRLTRPPRWALSCRAVCHDPDSGPPIPPIAGASVSHDDLVLEAADGNRFAAFAAGPDTAARCGVVVLPDVRGLHHFYEEVALRLGEQGVAAVAIDCFGRTAGVAKRDEHFPYADHVPQTRAASVQADVAAAVAHLRSQAGVEAVFTIGFCFGGRHSWLSAAGGHGLAGAIGFYGSTGPRNGEDGPIQRAAELRAPILALMGGADQAISAADVAAFDSALAEAGVEHEVVSYDGAPHSFFDRKQEQFADASADAWQRVLGFLEKHTPA
jgi:carboxymethylenebutenolidase